MPEILYNIDEKPDWERMVSVLQQFDEREQEQIYIMIQSYKTGIQDGIRKGIRIAKARQDDSQIS